MRVLLFVLPLAALAQSKQADVDKIFSGFNNHTPGCSVALAQGGKVALRAGYGMADLERNVPITADTVFESGSVAKQFTAMALLLLEKQGKISLDDPMRKYLPELPDYGTALTIRHVVSHLSGLREWRLMATFSGIPEGTYVLNNQDLLRLASKQKALNYDPGTAYSYTNTGFNIATILIERALGNGKTFQDFTRENIFEPLGMTHTRWRDDFRAVVPGRALAYTMANGAWQQDTPVENIIGAGGMLSTVGDWMLWNENFTTMKVGGADVVKAQQTPAVLASGKTISYAKGLVVDAFDGLREVQHGGSTGGYRTWIARYPDQGVSVAVMCNSAQADAMRLGRETARLWTGGKPANSAVFTGATKLEPFVGLYRKVRDNTVIEVAVKGGSLALGATVLTPKAETTFMRGDAEYRFSGNGIREVTADGETVFERVDPAHPSAADLAALAGVYESPEADVKSTIVAKGSELSIAVGSNAPVKLRPTFKDAFMMRGAAILFLRDESGKVTGFRAGDDRAWDVRFKRIGSRP
jgi:CubicO group peptidase (beta-lactamase class C family)